MTASIGIADQVMNIETVRFRRLVVFNITIFILHRVAIRHEYHLSNPKVFFSPTVYKKAGTAVLYESVLSPSSAVCPI